MRSTRLAGLFLSITLATLSSACSSAPEIDRARFTQDVCTAGTYQSLQRIKPIAGVDGVQLRTQNFSDGKAFVVETWGTLCGGAADKTACAKAVDALHGADTGWTKLEADMASPHYLVSTKGDAIALHATLADVRALFGTIDTPEEAAFLATASGEHRISCGQNAHLRSDGAYEILTQSGSSCGRDTQLLLNVVTVRPNGTVTVSETEVLKEGNPNCVVGRRTEGLAPCASTHDTSLGAFFAEMAHLEAAAVPAFERLARELAAHGAPQSLVVRAERSARDEIRHARMITVLAERFGHTPEPAVVEELPVRALEEIARENLTEGCVRETFGALLATYQAEAACDPQIAKVMRAIARDETRHAELAWDVAAWMLPRLDAEARARLERAVAEAIGTLRRDAVAPVSPEAMTLAGFPRPDHALELFDRLAPTLWAA